jgi:hypothetical protein
MNKKKLRLPIKIRNLMLRSPRVTMNLRNLKTRNQPTRRILRRKKRTAMKKNKIEVPL